MVTWQETRAVPVRGLAWQLWASLKGEGLFWQEPGALGDSKALESFFLFRNVVFPAKGFRPSLTCSSHKGCPAH